MQMWKKVFSFNFSNSSMWADYTKNLNHFWVNYENNSKKNVKLTLRNPLKLPLFTLRFNYRSRQEHLIFVFHVLKNLEISSSQPYLSSGTFQLILNCRGTVNFY